MSMCDVREGIEKTGYRDMFLSTSKKNREGREQGSDGKGKGEETRSTGLGYIKRNFKTILNSERRKEDEEGEEEMGNMALI